jgi:hypothetical protein
LEEQVVVGEIKEGQCSEREEYTTIVEEIV